MKPLLFLLPILAWCATGFGAYRDYVWYSTNEVPARIGAALINSSLVAGMICLLITLWAISKQQ